MPAGLLAAALSASATLAEQPLSWGDQGDGTYRNPVLNADYSDPDVVRVGADFYLVASDFHFVGIQVLHSRDLVNWRIIGQVFDRLAMDPKYDEMKGYAQGTWAPALRHHDGLFYLYVCTPGDGLYRWTARNPAGPWSEMVTVKTVERWEDPCPFWDDDGQAYLVHSLDGSAYVDTGLVIKLKFGQWKGARVALFSYGNGGGAADFDYLHLTHRPKTSQPVPNP
jgi:beta-xylosidase